MFLLLMSVVAKSRSFIELRKQILEEDLGSSQLISNLGFSYYGS
jgi:hypothetical protein